MHTSLHVYGGAGIITHGYSNDPALRERNIKSLFRSRERNADLYERLFDQSSEKASSQDLYNVLLLVLLVMTYAVDTSICERGFATMNLLKTKKRSCMRNELLRDLMTVCELGKDWKDPSKIPVKAIIKEWRNQSQSKRGRYEGAVWRASALDPPTMNGELDDEQLDRLAAHPDW
jgi:hypothetical protein